MPPAVLKRRFNMNHRDSRRLDPEYVTTRELSRRLSISRSTVRRHGLTRFGIFVGNGWRFRLADVIRFYEHRGSTSRDPSETLEPGDYRCRACGWIGHIA